MQMSGQNYNISYHWIELLATKSILIYITDDNRNVLISLDIYSDLGMGEKASHKCLCRQQYSFTTDKM